jgi:hypothetical protein
MPSLPDARTLSRWQRNAVLWALIEREGAVAVASLPREEPNMFFYIQDMNGSWRILRKHNNPGNTKYRQTFVFWFATLLTNASKNWNHGLANWRNWFAELEWHFRPRIEEE